MKKFFWYLCIVILSIIIFIGGMASGFYGKFFLSALAIKQAGDATALHHQKWLAWYHENNKNDQYGGKTPQETVELFVQAVEQGDLETASKYSFFQDQELQSLQYAQTSTNPHTNLDAYTSELQSALDHNQFTTIPASEIDFTATYPGEKAQLQYIEVVKESYTDYETVPPDGRILSAEVKAGTYTPRIDFFRPEGGTIWKFYN